MAISLGVGICAAAGGAGGCGNVTVDAGPGATRGDAGADGSAGGAGSAGTVACDVHTPFGAPVAAAAFNSDVGDDGLSFSSDGLTAYISSARSSRGDFDIFTLTRPSADQPFGSATALDGGINTADQERDPHVSRDGLKLYYFSNHGLGATFDLFVSTRASLSASFGPGVPLAALNSTANEFNPFPTSGDQVLYFASDRPGGAGGTDIYRAPLAVTATTVAPSLISEISTAASEYRPVPSDDGLTMYFDRVGAANDDILVATRATATDPFGPARAVTELNSAGIDYPIWLSTDRCTIYFGSDRSASGPGRNTGFDIYMAARTR